MDTETFVVAIKEAVRNPSIEGVYDTLKQVPGRSPAKRLTDLSTWYNSLSESDQRYVKQIIEESIDSALFGFLCVIDGVKAIEPDGDTGEFEVLYHRNGETTTLAPNDDTDYLHDLYNSK